MQFESAPAAAGRKRIGFGAALARAVRLSFRFRGRASRPEFWYFFLACALVVVAIAMISVATDDEWVRSVATAIWLACGVPFVSVGVRRLHDAGHTGWWCIGIVSCLGWLFLLAFWIERSKPGENRYGPPPR